MLVGPVNVSADLPPSRRFSSSASFWAYLSLSPTCSSLPCICSPPPPPLTFLTLVLPSLPPWPSSVFSASWVMSCGYGWLHGFASHVVAQEPTLRKPPCLGFNAVQLLSWSSQNIFECVSCGWSLMGQQSISQRLGISVLYNLSFLCLPGKGFWSPSLRPFTPLGPTFSPPPPHCASSTPAQTASLHLTWIWAKVWGELRLTCGILGRGPTGVAALPTPPPTSVASSTTPSVDQLDKASPSPLLIQIPSPCWHRGWDTLGVANLLWVGTAGLYAWFDFLAPVWGAVHWPGH